MSAGRLTVDTVPTPPGDWDAYVTGHADASAWQLAAAVGIGAASFGLRSYFLGARDAGGRLRGVLPLVEQRLVPWTRCLVSLPFCTYGGVLADDEAALAALPERQRVALTLFHYEGMSQSEVASVMAISEEAVESLLGRARRQL